MSALDPAVLAQRLRDALQESGLTQSELAAKAGVSRAAVIHELLSGTPRERNPLTLARLALALGRPWDWLGATPPAAIPPGPGRRLYTARVAHGWTLDDLAAASGVNRGTIHNLEHGTGGQARTWTNLARALDVSLTDLLDE
jgi:transcriptional regulator with XRE-family HTH domain